MREVFEPESAAPDPGRVFYTIKPEDVGKGVLRTSIGPIHLGGVLGKVLPDDVGKRLYRVQMNDKSGWIWQAENDRQRDARLNTPSAAGGGES